MKHQNNPVSIQILLCAAIRFSTMGEVANLPVDLGLMVLTTLEGEKATSEAQGLIQRAQGSRDITFVSLNDNRLQV